MPDLQQLLGTGRRAAAGALGVAVLVASAPPAAADDPGWPTSVDQFATQAGISTFCEDGHVGAAVYYTMKSGTPWSTGDGTMYIGPEYAELVPGGTGDPVPYGFGDLDYPEGAPDLWYLNDIGWDSYTIQEGDVAVVHYSYDAFGDGIAYGDVPVSGVLDCSAPQAVFRFWSPKFNNAHFFTTDLNEALGIIDSDTNWVYEGVAFQAGAASGGTCAAGSPVFRFYSGRYQSHFYTKDVAEKDHIIATDRDWAYEGVAYCASATAEPGTTALYRFWSPRFGKHFFTADQAEADHIRAVDTNWSYEGIAYYVHAG